SALHALLETLEDEDKFVSRSAALALGCQGVKNEQVVEECLDAINDPKDSLVRWRAAEALGKIGGARAVGDLLESLKDVEVREPAAKALELMSDEDLA